MPRSKPRCVKRSISRGEAATLVSMTTTTLRFGDVTLTRVSYAEVEVEPAQVGLTAEEVAAAHAPAEWVSGAQSSSPL